MSVYLLLHTNGSVRVARAVRVLISFGSVTLTERERERDRKNGEGSDKVQGGAQFTCIAPPPFVR